MLYKFENCKGYQVRCGLQKLSSFNSQIKQLHPTMELLDLATSQRKFLATLVKGIASGLTLLTDGQRVLLAQIDHYEIDLSFVEKIR